AADYPVPDFTAATTPDQLAEADLKLTGSMLDYARQAQSGRFHWSQVSYDILFPDHPTDAWEVLTNITAAKDASAALEGYNPPHKLYRELKTKLAELRGQGDGPMIQIAEGAALKYSPARNKKQPAVEMQDARVPQLRADLEHQGGHRPAGGSCDAAFDGDHEVHHGQSDLERAAVDHLQRISASAAAGSDRAAAHGAEAGIRPRRRHSYLAAARRSQ